MLREAQLERAAIRLVLNACFLSICVAIDPKTNKACRPSSCGDLHNISFPFRLQGDPDGCGYPEFELSCKNNLAMVNLEEYGKYYVAEINYDNHSIRVVDPGVKKGNCFSPPLYSFYWKYPPAYTWPDERDWNTIVTMNCEHPISDHKFIPIVPCSHSGNSSSSPTYAYALVGNVSLPVGDVPMSCTIGVNIFTQPLKAVSEPGNHSMSDLQQDLLMGFHLSFLYGLCSRECAVRGRVRNYPLTNNRIECTRRCSSWFRSLCFNFKYNWFWQFLEGFIGTVLTSLSTFRFRGNKLIKWSNFHLKGLSGSSFYCDYSLCYIVMVGSWMLRYIVLGRTILGMLCLYAYIIYKFRRRHLSSDDNIEELLQKHTYLQRIQYSYSEIKKMTNNFKTKLGQGGFGSVYKGKLQSGRIVAIKVLIPSKANGQDFINEVATLGRIHHINVVKLVGFCVQGSKWALVYDFMPNGSLDKFVFLERENRISLSWERLYKIAFGVGRGIEYLHQGCDMQILHFDIKPHNILLDADFSPKVSDFGLAKLYPADKSTVSLTAARGTLGYIAPELFYKNIGGVSYKADVYSFGMLLLEMVGRRKNVNAYAEHSSQIYFPSWIYARYDQGEEMDMGDATEDEKKYVKKMVIVALWCIQMKPIDRPSMNKALEMLEGEVELLKMPPKPTLYCEEMSSEDCMRNPNAAPISSVYCMDTSTLDGR